MDIGIIAAVSENYVIGKDGRIPWHFPEDLKRFKGLTFGHPVIMGRKTHESIGKPLLGRKNIVLSSSEIEGVSVVHSLEEAFDVARQEDSSRAYVMGGGGLYLQALDIADFMEITEVHREVEGDTFFPRFDKSDWILTARDDRGDYSFVTYEKKR